jgi:hypothetical protein
VRAQDLQTAPGKARAAIGGEFASDDDEDAGGGDDDEARGFTLCE